MLNKWYERFAWMANTCEGCRCILSVEIGDSFAYDM